MCADDPSQRPNPAHRLTRQEIRILCNVCVFLLGLVLFSFWVLVAHVAGAPIEPQELDCSDCMLVEFGGVELWIERPSP